MATSEEYVNYILEQLSPAGEIRCQKMFGEYGVYCFDKIIGVVCQNQLFLKVTPAGVELLQNCPQAAPYAGAKPHFLIENVEDKGLMGKLIPKMYEELPAPKPKRRKKNADA